MQKRYKTEIASTLAELHNLSTCPPNWNGYNALAPKHEAIQYAIHWIELFYQDVMDLLAAWHQEAHHLCGESTGGVWEGLGCGHGY